MYVFFDKCNDFATRGERSGVCVAARAPVLCFLLSFVQTEQINVADNAEGVVRPSSNAECGRPVKADRLHMYIFIASLCTVNSI